MLENELTASEALYGFVAWLTTREEAVTLSSAHDCVPIATLLSQFIRANKLSNPRENWQYNLQTPPEQVKLTVLPRKGRLLTKPKENYNPTEVS